MPTGLKFFLCAFLALLPLDALASRPHNEKGLSHSYAKYRASLIGNVRYNLSFALDGSQTAYSGSATVRFALKKAAPLTLDFQGGTIVSFEINGKTRKPAYNGRFIELPKEALRAGRNRVKVVFSHPYSTTGEALHRFVDPSDQRVYLYTDLEPYNANRVFPCFDQPDLKAVFDVTVEAPASWVVITAARERSRKLLANGRRRFRFRPSPRFSTYLFSLHAGAYTVWKAKAGCKPVGRKKKRARPEQCIPMRLFARRSIANMVDHKEWFDLTRRGLRFYRKLFDIPYPFFKYDQVLAPEMNYVGMENVAAVTLSDREFVFPSKPTLDQLERRARLVMHEMAHMWFGNLVTMKWWDDLWLNESFATYIAALAVERATPFQEKTWLVFFSGMKQWAYGDDEQVTSHAIATPVHSTGEAFANFDGITYGKGAAVLQQLSSRMTPKEFQRGFQQFLKEHAYKNADLDDFMSSLQKTSAADLKDFVHLWLTTPGLNTIRPVFSCAAGKITRFVVHQSAPEEHATLRPHRMQVGLFQKGDRLAIERAVVVDYEGASTDVAALVGAPCPYLVMPNYGDQDYVRIKLDTVSLKAVKADLSRVGEPLTRLMLWQALWDMVRDAEVSPQDYLRMLYSHLAEEKESTILSAVFQHVHGETDLDPCVLSYLPEKRRAKELAEVERFFWANMDKRAAGSDEQQIWFDAALRVTHSSAGLKQVKELLAGKKVIAGLALDQDRRWQLVRRLKMYGAPSAHMAFESEEKRDPLGRRAALAAEVVSPDPALKRKWFERITDHRTELSMSELNTVMDNLFPRNQAELRGAFAKDFYGFLAQPDGQKRTSEFLMRFTAALVPALCHESSTEALNQFLDSHPKIDAAALRSLRIAHQEDGRCVTIRRFASR